MERPTKFIGSLQKKVDISKAKSFLEINWIFFLMITIENKIDYFIWCVSRRFWASPKAWEFTNRRNFPFLEKRKTPSTSFAIKFRVILNKKTSFFFLQAISPRKNSRGEFILSQKWVFALLKVWPQRKGFSIEGYFPRYQIIIGKKWPAKKNIYELIQN